MDSRGVDGRATRLVRPSRRCRGDARGGSEARGAGEPAGDHDREPLPHARRGLSVAPVDDGRRGRHQVLRGEGRDGSPGGRDRARSRRAADPPVRDPAPDADRQPAGHQRVPDRSRPPDPRRRRRGDHAPRVDGQGQVPRAPGDRPLRRGPRLGARAVARQLPGRAGRRAAIVRVRQRRDGVRGRGGAGARGRRVRRVCAGACARRQRTPPRRAADRAPRRPAECGRGARPVRAREPRPRRADDRGGEAGDRHARPRRVLELDAGASTAAPIRLPDHRSASRVKARARRSRSRPLGVV